MIEKAKSPKNADNGIPHLLSNSHEEFIKNGDGWIEVQEQRLRQILKSQEESDFGKQYDFKSITSDTDYSKKVPIMSWENIASQMQRIRVGGTSPFLMDTITHIVPTSGTTGVNKRIPYTDFFLDEYRAGLLVWIADLYMNYPDLLYLKSFWSISPHIGNENDNRPDKFPDDLLYFGDIAPWIAARFAIDPRLTNISDFDLFMEYLMASLISTRDLGFISVWHPSYLIGMVQTILNKKEVLLEHLRLSDGEIGIPKITDHALSELRKILENYRDPGKLLKQLWPRLQLISCWGDAQSADYLSQIKSYFPDTPVQAKGLLATEGVMTIPIVRAKGSVPAYTGHYFEFLDNDDRSVPKQELEKDKDYSLLITSSNGFYRYRIGDRVKIVNWFGKLPVIRFTGRLNTLDLCGEKLSYDFILETLQNLFSEEGVHPRFYLFTPTQEQEKLGYQLFIESMDPIPGDLGQKLDKKLCDNFYYEHARSTKQLQRIRIIEVSDGLTKYREHCLQQGQLLGNIKYSHIDTQRIWKEILQ